MATSIYILDLNDFTEEELEDTPCATFELKGNQYGIILCDEDFWGKDNLVELLEECLDEEKVTQLSEKIREKAKHISYMQ